MLTAPFLEKKVNETVSKMERNEALGPYGSPLSFI